MDRWTFTYNFAGWKGLADEYATFKHKGIFSHPFCNTQAWRGVSEKKDSLKLGINTDGQHRKPGFPFRILKQAGSYFYIKFQLLLEAHLSMMIPEF